jgi:hypothetical protein
MQGMTERISASLSETRCRRHEFRGGWPILLANDQEWMFPTPEAFNTFRPDHRNMRDELVDGIFAAEDEAGQRRAELALMIHLLLLNYSVPPSDLTRLFARPTDEAAWSRMSRAFQELAECHIRAIQPRPTPVVDGRHLGWARLWSIGARLRRPSWVQPTD